MPVEFKVLRVRGGVQTDNGLLVHTWGEDEHGAHSRATHAPAHYISDVCDPHWLEQLRRGAEKKLAPMSIVYPPGLLAEARHHLCLASPVSAMG